MPCTPTIVKCARGSLKQVNRNTHTLTQSHTHTRKLNVRMNFVLFILLCLHFHIKYLLFVAGSVKKPSSFLISFSPNPRFPPPHTFSSSKTLSFPDFHSPNLFPLKLLFVDFIEEVRIGWHSLSVLFVARDFPFLTITCVPMARIMMYLKNSICYRGCDFQKYKYYWKVVWLCKT